MKLFGKKNTAQPQTEEVDSGLTPAEQVSAESGELIAIFAAAIAAYEAESYQGKLNIQKISRLTGARPIWAATGTQEAIDARRI